MGGVQIDKDHMCPNVRLDRSIASINKEWGAEFGRNKLTGKGVEVPLWMG